LGASFSQGAQIGDETYSPSREETGQNLKKSNEYQLKQPQGKAKKNM